MHSHLTMGLHKYIDRAASRQTWICRTNCLLHSCILRTCLLPIDLFQWGAMDIGSTINVLLHQTMNAGSVTETSSDFRTVNANLGMAAGHGIARISADLPWNNLVLSRELAICIGLLGNVENTKSCLFLNAWGTLIEARRTTHTSHQERNHFKLNL